MSTQGRLLLFGAAALLLAVTIALRQQNAPEPEVAASQLWQKLQRLGKQRVVYGTGNPRVGSAYRRFAEQSTRRYRRLEIVAVPDTELCRHDFADAMTVLIGTPQSNRWLRELVGRLPVRWQKGGIEIGGRFYSDPGDAVIISMLPNPLERSVPLSVVTGATDEAVVSYLHSRRRMRSGPGDYRVFRNGRMVAFGFFDANWRPDPARERDLLAETRALGDSRHFRFVYHGKRPLAVSVDELIRRYESWLAIACRRLAVSVDSLRIPVQVYDSFETKGLITGNTDLYHAEPAAGSVHIVINDDFRGDWFVAASRVLIARTLPKIKSPHLAEALAMALSRGWGERGFQYWAGYIAASGNIIPLDDLFDTQRRGQESSLFTSPLLGVAGDLLLRRFSGPQLHRLAANWPVEGLEANLPNGWTAGDLEKAWQNELTMLAAAVPKPQPAVFQPEFQKGFCYSHEGYQIYNGYLSEMSSESLARLRRLGVDWVSITPFAFVRAMDRPEPFRFSWGAGSENDESVLQAATAARKQGMKVMLKPHIWTRAGWPGELEMRTDADWQAFFDHYYRWIRHYALLAEMYRFDIFCVGVELSKATLAKPQAWREIIARIRRIYHGPLVYAANWGQEFENLSFWDALDYIGLNCYYPLSDSAQATADDLRRGAERVAARVEAVAARFGKPVLFTEVGFVSSPAPWIRPHTENRRSQPDMKGQALAYRVMFETMWDRSWFYGFYWWKWPSVPSRGGEGHVGFTPNGKPAAEVVAEWYLNRTPSRATGE